MHKKVYDVVIIGSGAGGGAVAKELAPLCADGKMIAVLEWGAKLRDDEFTGHEIDMASRLFFDSGGTFTKDREVDSTEGASCALLVDLDLDGDLDLGLIDEYADELIILRND